MKARENRKELLGKMERKETSVLTTLSGIQNTYGNKTEELNSRLDYAKTKIYEQTEVFLLD